MSASFVYVQLRSKPPILLMKFFRQLTCLALFLGSTILASAQSSKLAPLREAFAVCDVLDAGLRGKILHHLEQDSTQVPLELDLGVKLLSFSPQGLTLQTSEVGRWELRLLPLLGGNSLSAVIETVSAPQTDARLSFFDKDGRPLQTRSPLLTLPEAKDFIGSMKLSSTWACGRLRELLYPLHYEMSWQVGDEPILLVRPSVLLSEEDRQSTELMQLLTLLPTLTYRWTGSVFSLTAIK